MASLAEYFTNNRYKGVYDIGDRIFGRWNNIPFIGTVGTDSVVNEYEGPRITVTLDLPLLYDGKVYNVITVKHENVKPLVEF